MKYERPNAFIIYVEYTNVITTSGSGPLILGEDTGEDNIEIIAF